MPKCFHVLLNLQHKPTYFVFFRLNFSTPFSTNAISICRSVGLKSITRIEYSTRYILTFKNNQLPTEIVISKIVHLLHDKMTQCRYYVPLKSFDLDVRSDPIFEVDVMGCGRTALEKVNKELGLAFDDWDLDYYTNLFTNQIKRNPTSVECFDLAQSNSEHSRHWFFKGKLNIDGKMEHNEESLFSMIMDTQNSSNPNNIIKFNDNSSGIVGHSVRVLTPETPGEVSRMKTEHDRTQHIIFTAETHNFPTGVAPFPGATTGTGGRIRDVHATGRGAHVLAGTAGYSFGNLQIPGYKQPWEEDVAYPSNFASPLEIAVEASNGASDYGNKFGEPVLTGFARSFGQVLSDGERREYVKPIMFSGGLGMLNGEHILKQSPEKGMEVVKIGGPVYRIGLGGGAASSVEVQGDNKAELDYGAVQRGDAEMEQKLNRIIRACIEMKNKNPICSIHDQGAGGNGNVLKEIVEPLGAVIKPDRFQLGDPTLSLLEVWGAEYQESDAVLVRPDDSSVLKKLSHRERCPVNFVGTVTGTGRIDEKGDCPMLTDEINDEKLPYDLDLECVLGKMPRKEFNLKTVKPVLKTITLPDSVTISEALNRVLRLPTVASKRYLTNKVDRSVTGLIAQQQCVGPLHTPLADVAVTASSYFDKVGSATAIGEQPIKGLIDPAIGARMSVNEALTNLMFARITDLKDVKCSGNWMWPAKLPGEGVNLYIACQAMCQVMKELGIAVDGGKDSLSMAARVGGETIKAPGTLVISVYVPCIDITATVTPDCKLPGGRGCLLYVKLNKDLYRLGGTALAQCYKQIGVTAPDLDNPQELVSVFNIVQSLLKDKLITAGHDISDGGFITCLLEMMFSGNCGTQVNLPLTTSESDLSVLFNEEPGVILECSSDNCEEVINRFSTANITCYNIGYSTQDKHITVKMNDREVINEEMTILRDIWEETSFQLERYQTNPGCVETEQEGLKHRKSPPYKLTFDPVCLTPNIENKPRVAVLREEGSNGDREMAAAFHSVGFEVWDVNMQDLIDQVVTLDRFQGLAFVGGFSYADVCGSAKGWAATAKFNSYIKEEFTRFYNRPDTFSLGVCNGCQLMALLGWVGAADNSDLSQGLLLDHNTSERYESRYVTVKIQDNNSVMLKDMEGTMFGMWVSHGEGKMCFKTPELHQQILSKNLAPVRYIDDDGQNTQIYPFNPNGSPDAIAAVCSENGRHLAIMPHPERCFLSWQCPWMPSVMKEKLVFTPWIRMFQNAYDWCLKLNL
ncbi:hypothetical protein LOTGIDRAFT_172386 [Lottia gigantea]|uniref:Phosphoribosylformylglycinamidine synthase n=1 Tax=Lottia gigantea TaxID=225164 RepID=V4ACV3_LOTGI|nr:hypothetical protein LOTGIDRAFT_172386 [Lottia gigantea]ESP01829.1 hypothetical protein LOTGIDRAFT_172386 [Lottia gigantea]